MGDKHARVMATVIEAPSFQIWRIYGLDFRFSSDRYQSRRVQIIRRALQASE